MNYLIKSVVGLGLSSTWWSSAHNRHHAMPQRLHRDVDLETLPLVAFNARVAANPRDGNNFFVRNQVFNLKNLRIQKTQKLKLEELNILFGLLLYRQNCF